MTAPFQSRDTAVNKTHPSLLSWHLIVHNPAWSGRNPPGKGSVGARGGPESAAGGQAGREGQWAWFCHGRGIWRMWPFCGGCGVGGQGPGVGGKGCAPRMLTYTAPCVPSTTPRFTGPSPRTLASLWVPRGSGVQILSGEGSVQVPGRGGLTQLPLVPFSLSSSAHLCTPDPGAAARDTSGCLEAGSLGPSRLSS